MQNYVVWQKSTEITVKQAASNIMDNDDNKSLL